MKIKKHFIPLIATVLLLSLFGSSCKKKSNDPTPEEVQEGNKNPTNVPTGKLYMHLHNFIEEKEVDAYNVVYTDSYERKMSLSMGQVYLSNIELIKLDGSVFKVPNTIVLKQQDAGTYLLGDVPAGNYKTLRFNVGLDPATNQKAPSSASDDVLNQPSMWFSTTAQPEGYVFVNVQGKIDTTSDASGAVSEMQPFKYLIGTNANLKQRTMPDKNFTVVPNQAQYAHMLIDYTKLFTGIKLSNPANLKVENVSDNSNELAKRLAENIPSMIQYEE